MKAICRKSKLSVIGIVVFGLARLEIAPGPTSEITTEISSNPDKEMPGNWNWSIAPLENFKKQLSGHEPRRIRSQIPKGLERNANSPGIPEAKIVAEKKSRSFVAVKNLGLGEGKFMGAIYSIVTWEFSEGDGSVFHSSLPLGQEAVRTCSLTTKKSLPKGVAVS